MTARTIPHDQVFRSMAEQTVWAALRDQLPDGALLMPGLRLTGEGGQDREADLVVAWPGAGIAVIEVKGGHVSLDAGRWLQQHADGRVSRIRPVDQARECKYALRRYLDLHPAWSRPRPRLAHLVAFPSTAVPAMFGAPDCPRGQVIGRDDVGRAAEIVRGVLVCLVDAPPPPTDDDVVALRNCLYGALLPQQSLVERRLIDIADTVARRERDCELLTAAQARVLDQLRRMPRVEILGGAGSGKTWLAVEQARRLSAQGRRVGLVCYSRGLAAFLRRRVQTFPAAQRPAYAGTFHGLGVDWLDAPTGSDDDSDFWEARLPEAMAHVAAARPASQRFDAFVVDEAQDFAAAWWPVLLSFLRDPGAGGLTVFADEGQRVFARQGEPPVELPQVELDENLRNTRQIARTFGSLAPRQMRYRGGDGAPVRFVPCRTEDALNAADDAAVALLDEGWAPEHVALLTTGSRHPVQVERQAGGGPDGYWDSFWDGSDLFYGHVLGFKGLERPAVVLAVNGFRNLERAAEMLYVGLSRARDRLVVCGDHEQVRAVGGEAVARRLGIMGT